MTRAASISVPAEARCCPSFESAASAVSVRRRSVMSRAIFDRSDHHAVAAGRGWGKWSPKHRSGVRIPAQAGSFKMLDVLAVFQTLDEPCASSSIRSGGINSVDGLAHHFFGGIAENPFRARGSSS